jgi:hypothetical protein
MSSAGDGQFLKLSVEARIWSGRLPRLLPAQHAHELYASGISSVP